MSRVFITEEEAINLLPEGKEIHTYRNSCVGVLLGCDWERGDILNEIKKADHLEITGSNSRAMCHGLAIWNDGDSFSDILFVETDMEKLNRLYPEEEEDED